MTNKTAGARLRNLLMTVCAVVGAAGACYLLNINRINMRWCQRRGPDLLHAVEDYSSVALHRTSQIAVTVAGVFDPSNTSLALAAERLDLTDSNNVISDMWRQIHTRDVLPLKEKVQSEHAADAAPTLVKQFNEVYWPFSEVQGAREVRTIDTFEVERNKGNTNASLEAATLMTQDDADGYTYWDVRHLLYSTTKMEEGREADKAELLGDVEDNAQQSILVAAISGGLIVFAALVAGCNIAMTDKNDEPSVARSMRKTRRCYGTFFILFTLVVVVLCAVTAKYGEHTLRDMYDIEVPAAITAAELAAQMQLAWAVAAGMAMAPSGSVAVAWRNVGFNLISSFQQTIKKVEDVPIEVTDTLKLHLSQLNDILDAVPTDPNSFDRDATTTLFRDTLEVSMPDSYATTLGHRKQTKNDLFDVVDYGKVTSIVMFSVSISIFLVALFCGLCYLRRQRLDS